MQQEKMGCLLRELRKEKGITQEQMAEIFGVSNRSVSRWENGKSMPDITILLEISDYFEIDILELIEGERKQNMNEEKIKISKVAEYADNQKLIVLKKIQIADLIGSIASIVAIISIGQYLKYETSAWILLSVLSLGLVSGLFLFKVLYSAGVIDVFTRYKKKYRMLRYLELIILIINIVGSCWDSYMILHGRM